MTVTKRTPCCFLLVMGIWLTACQPAEDPLGGESDAHVESAHRSKFATVLGDRQVAILDWNNPTYRFDGGGGCLLPGKGWARPEKGTWSPVTKSAAADVYHSWAVATAFAFATISAFMGSNTRGRSSIRSLRDSRY